MGLLGGRRGGEVAALAAGGWTVARQGPFGRPGLTVASGTAV